jgi:hypothetical protein
MLVLVTKTIDLLEATWGMENALDLSVRGLDPAFSSVAPCLWDPGKVTPLLRSQISSALKCQWNIRSQ